MWKTHLAIGKFWSGRNHFCELQFIHIFLTYIPWFCREVDSYSWDSKDHLVRLLHSAGFETFSRASLSCYCLDPADTALGRESQDHARILIISKFFHIWSPHLYPLSLVTSPLRASLIPLPCLSLSHSPSQGSDTPDPLLFSTNQPSVFVWASLIMITSFLNILVTFLLIPFNVFMTKRIIFLVRTNSGVESLAGFNSEAWWWNGCWV